MCFWNATTMRGDPLCFVDRGDGAAVASLLFPPEGMVSLRSASGDVRDAADAAPSAGGRSADDRRHRRQHFRGIQRLGVRRRAAVSGKRGPRGRDGINHPNDFGHRVHAETILARLVDR